MIVAHSGPVEDRLRRYLIIIIPFFIFSWAGWMIVTRENWADYYTEIANDRIILTLTIMAAISHLLAAFMAAQVLWLQHPTSRTLRHLRLLVPRRDRARAGVERWAWLPVDLCLVIFPLLSFQGMRYLDFVEFGYLTKLDFSMSYVATLLLVGGSIMATMRFAPLGAAVYILGVQVIRFALFMRLNPDAFAGAMAVTATAAIYGWAAFMYLNYLRGAARTMDGSITDITTQHRSIARQVAQIVSARDVSWQAVRHVSPALQRIGDARTQAANDGARAASIEALHRLDSFNSRISSDVQAPLTPQALLTLFSDVGSSVDPRIEVDVRSAEGFEISRLAADHLTHATRILLSAAVNEGPLPAVRVHLDAPVVHVELALGQNSESSHHMRDAMDTVTHMLQGLPGARLSCAQGETQRIISLTWRDPQVEALSGAKVDQGITEEVFGLFRVVSPLPTPRAFAAGILSVIVMVACFVPLIVVTWPLQNTTALTIVQVVLLVSFSIAVVFAGVRWPQERTVPHFFGGTVAFGAVLLSVLSLVNLTDFPDIAIEAQWWQGTATLVTILWVQMVYSMRVSIILAVTSMMIVIIWSLTYSTNDATAPAGVLTLLSVLMAAAAFYGATRFMIQAVLVRRRQRLYEVADAHSVTAQRARSEHAHYLDSTIRPLLSQQAAGFPATEATRQRARVLRAQLTDDARAPLFRESPVTRAAADARARGVIVHLHDSGVTHVLSEYVHERLVVLTAQALDAIVEGRIDIQLMSAHHHTLAIIHSRPDNEEARRTVIFPDASVEYDGILVRAPAGGGR